MSRYTREAGSDTHEGTIYQKDIFIKKVLQQICFPIYFKIYFFRVFFFFAVNIELSPV